MLYINLTKYYVQLGLVLLPAQVSYYYVAGTLSAPVQIQLFSETVYRINGKFCGKVPANHIPRPFRYQSFSKNCEIFKVWNFVTFFAFSLLNMEPHVSKSFKRHFLRKYTACRFTPQNVRILIRIISTKVCEISNSDILPSFFFLALFSTR